MKIKIKIDNFKISLNQLINRAKEEDNISGDTIYQILKHIVNKDKFHSFKTIKININEKNVFFTSDPHLQHKNIIKYCNRPFKSLDEMNSTIIKNWNDKVGKDDIVFIGGDFCFGGRETWSYLLDNLNGIKYLANGNHDKGITLDKFVDVQQFFNIRILGDKEIASDGQRITICHYPMISWYQSHRGAWQLYGHCVDMDTEILTKNGWVIRNEIQEIDDILTLNTNTSKLEYNKINDIIDINYSGDVYEYNGKSIDFRVTDKHRMIEYTKFNNKYRYYLANELLNLNKRYFIKSGIYNQDGVDLNENEIRLFIQIVADGNLCNSSLCRIKVHKQRKKHNIRRILLLNGIFFHEKKYENGSISFNFTIPDKLKKYSFKPIDNVIHLFNENQFDILVDEYSKTDGHKYSNTVVIYTSKKEEVERISSAAIKNGYACNISSRLSHGFSKGESHDISLTKRKYNIVSDINKNDNIKISKVKNEKFWCVNVDNSNFFIRRNGKIHLTGNCHGGLSNKGKIDDRLSPNQLDIGVDVHNFTPISYEEVKTLITKQNLK